MKELSIVDTTKDVTISSGKRNFWYSELGGTGYYYWISTGSDADHIIYRQADLESGSPSAWQTITKDATYKYGSTNACIKQIGNMIFFIFAAYNEAADSTKLWLCDWDGTTFDASKTVTVTSETITGYDIFQLGSTIYFSYCSNDVTFALNTKFVIRLWESPYTAAEDTDCYRALSGFVIDNVYYYFMYSEANSDFRIKSWNATSFALVEALTGFTTADAATMYADGMFMYNSGNYWVQWNKVVAWRSKNSTNFSIERYSLDSYSYTRNANGYLDYAFIQDASESIGYMFKFFPKGGFIKIKVSSALSYTVGWEDYIIIYASFVYHLYKIQPATYGYNMSMQRIHHGYQQDGFMLCQDTKTWARNEGCVLYNSSDVCMFAGAFVNEKEFEDGKKLYFESAWDRDLHVTVNLSVVNMTPDAIYKYLCDNYASVLTYTASSIDAIAGAINIDFNNELIDCIGILDRICHLMHRISPDGILYVPSAVPSTSKNISSGFMLVDEKRDTEVFGTVIINYSRNRSVVRNNPSAAGSKQLIDDYPNINDEDQAKDIADSLLAENGSTRYKFIIELQNQGRLAYGYSLLFSFAPYSISEDTYYIQEDDYYVDADLLQIGIADGIIYPQIGPVKAASEAAKAIVEGTTDIKRLTIGNEGLFKSTAAGSVFKTTADGSTPSGYTERSGYAPTSAVIVASQTTHTKVLKIEHTTNSDYGLMAYTINTDYKTAVTVEAWIYHSTTSGNFVRFAITATDYSTEGFGIQIQSDGRIQLTNSTGGAYANLNQFVLAGWHHYKLIYNSNATSYLFVDGVLCYQQTAWNNSTPKALLLELGVYKATTGTATAYFDAIAFHYETGYVNFMGWADGQLNIRNTPVDPNNPMADGWHLIPYQAAREFNEDTTAAWTNKSVAAYIPSWAKWILLLISAYGAGGGYWYVGVAQGGSGGANAIYCESEGTGASRLIVPVELDASLQFQYYNRSTNKHADYPIFRVMGYK